MFQHKKMWILVQHEMSSSQWGRVMHIYVGNLTLIGSDNGLLSPDWRQAITWTNAGILLNGHLETNFNEILIKIHTYSLKNAFKNVVCETKAILSQPQCVNCIILSWCWWDLVTSANQIAQNGSCDRSRIHNHDLGGTGVWPGKK